MNYFVKYFMPSILLIGLAFYAGTHPNPIFALAGFLSFFVIGIAVLIEGRKKKAEKWG